MGFPRNAVSTCTFCRVRAQGQHSLGVHVVIIRVIPIARSTGTRFLLVAHVPGGCFQTPRLGLTHPLSLLPLAPPQEDILELKRQLSLADGQLRKSEVSRKRLEICNKKLLLFVQVKR